MATEVSRWSTRDVQPRRAIDYWNELLGDNILRLSVRSRCRVGFGGHMTGAPLGAGRLYYVAAANDQDARHDRASVARRTDDSLCLVQMRAGAFHIEAARREAHLAIGDCVLLDSKACFRFRLPESSASLVLRFTSSWLRRWLPHYEDFTATRIAGDRGWGRTLTDALNQLDPDSVGALPLSAGDVADQIGGLLALACGPARSAHAGTRALCARLVVTIRARACEPQLTPRAVAEAEGISLRYLHKVLAADGTTFCNVLYGERLRIARNLLAVPEARRPSLAAVASATAFADGSHLRRRLRGDLSAAEMEGMTSCTHPRTD